MSPKPTLVEKGFLNVTSPEGIIEVLADYEGPSTENDLNYALPARRFDDVPDFIEPVSIRQLQHDDLTRSEARVITTDRQWKGMCFLLRVNALPVDKHATTVNIFSTRVGNTIHRFPHWLEVGIIRSAEDPAYRLFAYDSGDINQYVFFGEALPGQWYELAIRVRNEEHGPFPYNIYCDGMRVRAGSIPVLHNQVDLVHETWTNTGKLSEGDDVFAEKGWLFLGNNRTKWFGPDVPVRQYVTGNTSCNIKLFQPHDHPAYVFEAYS